MGELKFRYVVKNKHTGVIYFKYYTLNQIETSGIIGLFDIENYEIISRDRYHRVLSDLAGVDIYEGDLITHSLLEGMGEPTIHNCNSEVSFYVNYYYYFNIKVTGNIHENN